MDKPKILVFHHSGAIGGGGVSMLHMLKSLDREKYQVKVYCPGEPDDMRVSIANLGYEAVAGFDKGWVYPHFNGRHYLACDPRFIQAIRHIWKSKPRIKRILQEEKPDLLLLNSVTLYWMASIAKELGIKTLCFDRETLPKSFPGIRTQQIIRSLNRDCDSIAYLSKYDKFFCQSPDNKGYVIHDRVDLSLFDSPMSREEARKQLGLIKDGRYILYMGGVWPVKGADVIIKALKDVDARLLFLQYEPPKEECITMGDRQGIRGKIRYVLGLDYEARVLNRIDRNNLWKKVVFAPAQGDMLPWLAACDVVVFPSQKPHQARPIYEAGMAKRPIIVSDFENTAEFAKDQVNALTFKPGDSKDLSMQIHRLLADQELTDRLVESNYHKSVEEHDLKTLHDEINQLVDNTLKGE